jgi:hypothetical protein
MAIAPAPVMISNSVQQREQSCKRTLKSFDPQTATTREQIGYSDCVQLLYPKEIARQEADAGFLLSFLLLPLFVVIVAVCREIEIGRELNS